MLVYMFLHLKSRICGKLFPLLFVFIMWNCAKSRKLEGDLSADESRYEVMHAFPKPEDRANFMELRIGERALLGFLKKYFGDDALKLFDKNGYLDLKELRRFIFDRNDFFDFFADSIDEGYVVGLPNLSQDPDIKALIELINKNGKKLSKAMRSDSQESIKDIDSIVKKGIEKIYEFLKNYIGDENAIRELEEFMSNNGIDESGQFVEPTCIYDEGIGIPTVEIDLRSHDNKIFSAYAILMERNNLALKEPKDGAAWSNIKVVFEYPKYNCCNREILVKCVLKVVRNVMNEIKQCAIKYKKAEDHARNIDPKHKSLDPRATPFQAHGKDWSDADGKSNKVYFKNGVEIDPTDKNYKLEFSLDTWAFDQVYSGFNFETIMNNFKNLKFDDVDV